jgi:hypothetical protein
MLVLSDHIDDKHVQLQGTANITIVINHGGNHAGKSLLLSRKSVASNKGTVLGVPPISLVAVPCDPLV